MLKNSKPEIRFLMVAKLVKISCYLLLLFSGPGSKIELVVGVLLLHVYTADNSYNFSYNLQTIIVDNTPPTGISFHVTSAGTELTFNVFVYE